MKSNFILYDDTGEDPIEKYESEIFDCEDQGMEHDFMQQDGFEVCVTCGEVKEDGEDDESLYTFNSWVMEALTTPLEPNKPIRGWWGVPCVTKIPQRSKVRVFIKKKAFNKLRKIAMDAFLYKGTETSAILFGKGNEIHKVKKFNANYESPGLVSSNSTELLKALSKKKFIGFFHSHTFGSSSPSSTDVDCLSGWKAYKEPHSVFSLIGCPPHFKQRAWSMNDKFEMVEHDIVVI